MVAGKINTRRQDIIQRDANVSTALYIRDAGFWTVMPAKSTLYQQQVRIMTLRLMDRALPGFFGANLLHLLFVLDTHAAAARAPTAAN